MRLAYAYFQKRSPQLKSLWFISFRSSLNMFWSGKVKVIKCKTCGELSLLVRWTTGIFVQIAIAVCTEMNFFPLLTRPQEFDKCQMMGQHPLNSNLDIWCAKIGPNLKIKRIFEKPSKLKKIIKKPMFSHGFSNIV